MLLVLIALLPFDACVAFLDACAQATGITSRNMIELIASYLIGDLFVRR